MKQQLANVTRGKIDAPLRVLLYGVEKIGKSTFASEAPSPIYICPEDGTSSLDVVRFPEPEAWGDVVAAVDELLMEEHGYKTLVLDTLDWLAPFVHRRVVDAAPVGKSGVRATAIEDVGGGYGKGYVAALEHWRSLLARLGQLRAKKQMHIVMLAHARIKRFINPEGDDFDRYELKLSGQEAGLLKEWCDAVLFANYETATLKSKDETRAKGVADGARYIHTVRRAAYDAGNRYSLPEQLPLDWTAFWEAVQANKPARADAIAAQIEALVQGNADLESRARVGVEACAGDAETLARLLNKVRATVLTA
jgi:hypothetical protein